MELGQKSVASKRLIDKIMELKEEMVEVAANVSDNDKGLFIMNLYKIQNAVIANLTHSLEDTVNSVIPEVDENDMAGNKKSKGKSYGNN